MRAIQQTEFGGPEVLQLVELPEPVAGPGEVLVRVTRAGLNFADTHAREDAYVAAQTLPLVPGSEVAGVREDTGERVVALVGTGGYAEYAVAAADRVVPIPDGVSDEVALALLLQGLTAWHLYATFGRVEPGETVLVVSGAGGVGSLAVQLGARFGARVLATASSAQKRDLCLRLGAEAAFDTGSATLGEEAGRVDVVFEMAGGEVFDQCLAALGERGRMVVYGISSREKRQVSTARMLRASQSFIGFWLFHYLERPGFVADALADLFALAASGSLEVVVGGVWPLAEAPDAQRALTSRTTTGKLLLDPTR